MKQLHLLSGGAAFGLVSQLEGRFKEQTGYCLASTFNAVGAMRDQLLAGATCDVLILTQALIQQLEQDGHVVAASARNLGTVRTGIAVKTGAAVPAVATAADLKRALEGASGIYFPDPVKATAGIHFMKVLQQLGLDHSLADRLRPYPNGATAMGAMAGCDEVGLLGCTQITEILVTPGVQLVAPLPPVFELATVYTAGVCARAAHPDAARALIALLTHSDANAIRLNGGFEIR